MAGTFFFGYGFGTFWVLLNLYLRELGLPESQIGRLLSAQSVGMLATALLAAYLLKRTSFRTMLTGAVVLSTLAYTGLSVLTETWGLLAAGFFAGAGFAVHHVVAAPFFMQNSSPRERIYLFGLSWALEVVASVIAIALGGLLAEYLGDRLDSPLLGLRITLLVATGLVCLALIPYSLLKKSGERRQETKEKGHGGGPRLIFKLALPSFLVGCGAGLIIPFLNLYFRDRFSVPTDGIGWIFAVAQALTAVGYLVGPAIANRIGMIRTVVAAELLSIPFFLTLAFTMSFPVAIVAFWFRGALMNMNHPVASNFAMEVVGKDRQAITNSILMMAWNGAWMISTQVGGILIENHGFALPILITVGLYFSSSLIYLYFFHNYEDRLGLRTRSSP
ncbi:MAG: MFS transporter [Candidatus Eisenbacteria bacterium]|uniref:MFS transporter n=1 Tax=Eiseniibacteriota bacterium TaxID=2212470 RepID=A0A7Y2EA09_UNCEI|nr:MFS transporter [Candidatus Eisenbacteria bacterium]